MMMSGLKPANEESGEEGRDIQATEAVCAKNLETRAQGVFRLAGESQEDVVGKRPRGSDTNNQCKIIYVNNLMFACGLF